MRDGQKHTIDANSEARQIAWDATGGKTLWTNSSLQPERWRQTGTV